MERYVCADASRQAGEAMIGSASQYRTYILIECPPPWAPDAFDSHRIPSEFKQFVDKVSQLHPEVRFLLIARGASKAESQRVLIYDQMLSGYQKSEWMLNGFDAIISVVQNYLAFRVVNQLEPRSNTRDILICTHGSHDYCCARYGGPFYTQAVSTVTNLGLNQVRIWRSSHFGGHRFAPTAIDFPDGRYYGGLNQASFQALLLRAGNIQYLSSVYRGWGILPSPVQVMERGLMLAKNWNWFDYKLVSYRSVEQASDNTCIQAEMVVETPDAMLQGYRATLLQDLDQTVCLKGSCNAEKASKFIKYRLESLSNLLLLDVQTAKVDLASINGQLQFHEAMRNPNIVE